VVNGFDEWKKGMKEVAMLGKSGENDQVIRKSEAISKIYPEFVETGNLYELRANAFLALDDKPDAIAELEHYAKIGGRSPETLKKLASLEVEAGHPADAAATLTRLNYIIPWMETSTGASANLWLAQNNIDGAIREYQAVLAWNTVDPATSHFNLAQAYRRANRPDDARDQLLLSLEAAPGYRPAQRMLLELSQSEQGK